tara:strand:- start:959 stop:1219 length:261 start_codon:yes stop_codon:yes gene_type:complete
MNPFNKKKVVVTRDNKIEALGVKKTSILGSFYKAVDELKDVQLSIIQERSAIAEEKELLEIQERTLVSEYDSVAKLVTNFEKLLNV